MKEGDLEKTILADHEMTPTGKGRTPPPTNHLTPPQSSVPPYHHCPHYQPTLTLVDHEITAPGKGRHPPPPTTPIHNHPKPTLTSPHPSTTSTLHPNLPYQPGSACLHPVTIGPFTLYHPKPTPPPRHHGCHHPPSPAP